MAPVAGKGPLPHDMADEGGGANPTNAGAPAPQTAALQAQPVQLGNHSNREITLYDENYARTGVV